MQLGCRVGSRPGRACRGASAPPAVSGQNQGMCRGDLGPRRPCRGKFALGERLLLGGGEEAIRHRLAVPPWRQNACASERFTGKRKMNLRDDGACGATTHCPSERPSGISRVTYVPGRTLASRAPERVGLERIARLPSGDSIDEHHDRVSSCVAGSRRWSRHTVRRTLTAQAARPPARAQHRRTTPSIQPYPSDTSAPNLSAVEVPIESGPFRSSLGCEWCVGESSSGWSTPPHGTTVAFVRPRIVGMSAPGLLPSVVMPRYALVPRV